MAALLDQLQGASPAMCWDFTHHVPVDIETHVGNDTLDALKAALRQVHDDVKDAPAVGLDAAEKTRVLAALLHSLPVTVQNPTVAALRPDGDHAAFCPALRTVLDSALALPPADRGPALRALLSGQP